MSFSTRSLSGGKPSSSKVILRLRTIITLPKGTQRVYFSGKKFPVGPRNGGSSPPKRLVVSTTSSQEATANLHFTLLRGWKCSGKSTSSYQGFQSFSEDVALSA